MLDLKNKTVLFACRFGSHLYGTNTPQSDYDEKGVYLETFENIVLGTASKQHGFSTGNEKIRNNFTDVDYEYKELRTFLHEAMAGQTWAMDMLFCNAENTLRTSDIWKSIQANRSKILSKNVKPFVGYCRQQAGKYSLKGNRLAALEAVIDEMNKLPTKYTVSQLVIEENEFVKWYENGKFLDVLGRKFERTLQIERALESLKKLRERYGQRAEIAKDNGGIDWKAVSHAYRCMFEAKALLTTGEIVFPLPQAELIVQIKTGQISLARVNDDLSEMMDEIESLAAKSTLPENPDRKFWNDFILGIYLNRKD